MLQQGNINSAIMFLTDKQGVHCRAEGKVFGEYLGAPLFNALRTAGIRERDYSFVYYESLAELKQVIAESACHVIVPLGEQTLRDVTGLSGISKWHCSTVPSTAEYGMRKCLPMYHPDHVMRFWSDHVFLLVGCQKLLWERHSPKLLIPERKFHTTLSCEEAIKFLKEKCMTAHMLGVDFEFGLGQINTVGFAISRTEAIAIKTLPDDYTPEQYQALWCAIAEVLESKVPKVIQHVATELTWAARYGIQLNAVHHDTMWAMKFLHPELDKGLDNVGRMYTPFPYWKDDNDSWTNIRDWQRHLSYNCCDTTASLWAYQEQRQELRERKLFKLFYDFVMKFQPVIQEMCVTGLTVNPEAILKIKEDTERDRDNYQKILDQECLQQIGKTINPRSPKQLKEALQAMGMVLPMKKGKGQDEAKQTADKKALVKLRRKHPDNHVLPALIGLSATNKKLSSYVDFNYDRKTNKLYYTLDGAGTETGRWCIRKGTIITGAGTETRIEDVKVGDLVYCYDDNLNLQLKKVLWAGKTGHKKLLRIHWKTQTGRCGYLDVTPEHKIRLLDGTYVRADELRTNNRTLALVRYLDCGYVRLLSKKQRLREHCFIFEQHHGYKPEIVHHIDGDNLNNNINNLAGMTIKDHVSLHALEDGRKPPHQPTHEQRARGSNNGAAILNEEQVLKIKELIAVGKSNHYIAGMFAVSTGCIKSIRCGRNWKHVQLNNHIITSIEHLNETDDVYDLEIEDCHNFIANEICVHNSGYGASWGGSLNPQTVPKSVRRVFIAEPGTVLVQIDLKQAESRYVAWDGPDAKFMELLESGQDIHRYVAGQIFKKPEQLVTDFQRQLGKKAGHASNYGTGARTFAEMALVEMNYYLEEREAKDILEGYMRAFPGVRRRQQNIKQEVYNKRMLKTPLGRERYFYGRMDDSTFREAYAYCPQSTIPDITNHLMLKLWDNRDYIGLSYEEGGRFLLQVHDSLLLQCKPERVGELAEFVRDIDQWHPFIELAGGRLRIPTDIEVGTDWKNMEKL